MSGRLEIQFLPARQGDAIWVRWGRGRQLMIDMGTEETGRRLAKRIAALPVKERRFELLVITHVDEDHLGGVLTCVSDNDSPVPGLAFKDVWFNGFEHLHGKQVAPPKQVSGPEAMGPAQGERLTSWLRDHPWNKAFDRFPVALADGGPRRVKLPDGLTLTVLGPTQARLGELIKDWKKEVKKAVAKGKLEEVSPGLGPLGEPTPPRLESRQDLLELAKPTSKDTSKPNHTSITLLLEWRGRRVLLTGDALAGDVASALLASGLPVPVKLDLLKLPHHGSRQNLSQTLVEAVDCPYWAFCTDGTQFRHPDAAAIARLLAFGRHPRPTLGFNVPSEFNLWWKKPKWRTLFDYEVEYGNAVDGLTVSFEPALA